MSSTPVLLLPVLVLLLGGGLPLSLCQSEPAPDCQELGFEAATMPSSGAGLEMCSTDQQQCCTNRYISEVKDVAERTLNNGLNQELNETSSQFRMTVGRIKNYLTDPTFREEWKFSLPNPGGFFNEQKLSENYDRLIGNFFDDLIIDSTSPNSSASELFVQKIIDTATNSIGNLLGGTNMSINNCIVGHLNAIVNNNVRSDMTRHLEILRGGVTALVNYEQFLTNYSQSANFVFPIKCANELTSISFCGRCNSTFPPLCSKTCGALIRGCYSPYYDALPKQFSLLWNVSIQVLHVLNTTLQDLFAEGRRLFSDVSVGEIRQVCGGSAVTFPDTPTVPSRPAPLIANSRIQELRGLEGRELLYNSDGNRPLICRQSSAEGQDCMDRCAISSFCTVTSRCPCYNGSAQSTDDNVQIFTDNTKRGQKGNPAIALNMDDFTTTVDSIGQPIRVFLEQQPPIPGVVIPEDTTEATTVSGSAMIGATPVLLALGIFFNTMI